MNTKITITLVTILCGVLGWFGNVQYTKLSEIEKSLVEVKLEMVKIQATMMDREAVVAIVEQELAKHKNEQ